MGNQVQSERKKDNDFLNEINVESSHMGLSGGVEKMNREYYKDINYNPYLFYVVFGVSTEQLQVSRKKHHVDELPAGLDMRMLNRRENADYIDGFFSGSIGKILEDKDYELFEHCKNAEECIVISGKIKDDATFAYMRNVVGFIQAFVENGACGILDCLTFSWFAPQEWSFKYFEKEVNAQDHVIILYSKEENGYWLHTRGMAKFGRPDISIENVEESDFNDYKQIVDQMIFYGGHGVFFEGKFRLHTKDKKTFLVQSEFINDFENNDFNNAYCKVAVIQEVVE